MDRLLIIFSVLFLVSSFVADVAFSENNVEPLNGSKKKVFWFETRLSRRKRDPRTRDESRRLSKDQLDALLDIIQDSTVAIVALNDGNRHMINFTPRLGRESGEELASNGVPNLGDKFMQDGDMMSQRSPPFAPRLGRRISSPFSQRLGRENDRS